MAKPNSEIRIKNAQNKANKIWEDEIKYWNGEADKHNKDAANASSEISKKQHSEKSNHAKDCVEYCRAKIS